MKKLRIIIKPRPFRHVGWGMSSNAALPFDSNDSTDVTGLAFEKVNKSIHAKVQIGKFVMTQNMVNGKYVKDPYEILRSLSWRHYMVYWSTKFAMQVSKHPTPNIVEAGVCDGLTITFAIESLKNELSPNSNYKIFLYDSWDTMKDEFLTDTERQISSGGYSYLSLERTKANLEEYSDNCTYIRGFIPDVFKEVDGPEEISWLHIDLNSSMPTQKTLEHFLPRLLSGGIVLFDDYGWKHCHETREVADRCCAKFAGLMMPFPNGQAIFFKH